MLKELKSCWFIFVFIILVFVIKSYCSDQVIRFVADTTCISIDKTQQTKFIAPVVDGKPDLKHGHLEGVHAVVDTNCGRIEIVHVK